ncbi:MAG: histidine--tRNA ligase [Solirubrobacteraceae bacterium]
MSAPRLTAPRGTHDVLPDEATRRERLDALASDLFARAGYRRIETPIFEATELFARGVGASTDVVQKEMYTFEDRGERSLTLRPEGTAGVARSYLEHGMHKLPQPVRVWYSGPFFRYERAQAGRQRQFQQIGCEAIGSDDPALDAESIALLHQLIVRFVGADGIRLRIGSLGSIEGRAAYRERLVAYLRAHEDRLSTEVRERIDLNPLRAFDADDPGTKAVMADAPRLLEHLLPEDAEHFAEVRVLLDAVGIAYEVDPTLVRGLDYYSRTLFEFTSDALGAQSGVGGGGRYDGLIEQLGGPSTPAVGWAAGVERLLLAAGPGGVPDRRASLYVLWDESRRRDAFVASRTLGRAQLDAAGRGMKGQRRRAERAGARIWLTLPADGGYVVRDREGGRETTVADVDAVEATLAEWFDMGW